MNNKITTVCKKKEERKKKKLKTALFLVWNPVEPLLIQEGGKRERAKRTVI